MGDRKIVNKKDLGYKKRRKLGLSTAEEVFEINSLNEKINFDIVLHNHVEQILSKYRPYSTFNNIYIPGLLPYVMDILAKMINFKLKYPLSKHYPHLGKLEIYEDNCRNRLEEKLISSIDLDNIRIINMDINAANITEILQLKCFTVDLSILMPSEIFDSKDYLNYIYFMKRASFVGELYNHFKSEFSINKIKGIKVDYLNYNKLLQLSNNHSSLNKMKLFNLIDNSLIKNTGIYIEYLNDLNYTPILCLKFELDKSFSSKTKGILNCKFRLLPCFESDCMPNKALLPYRNCVRSPISYTDNETIKISNPGLLPPTPQYNGALLSNCLINEQTKKFVELFQRSEIIKDTLILLILWSRKWNLTGNYTFENKEYGNFTIINGLGVEILAFLLRHIYENDTNGFILKLTPLQLFRISLTSLKLMIESWLNGNKNGYYIIGNNQVISQKLFNFKEFENKTDKLHLFNSNFICKQLFILYDESMIFNIFWRYQNILEELKITITKTLTILNYSKPKCHEYTINSIFMRPNECDDITKTSGSRFNLFYFDACFLITYPMDYKPLKASMFYAKSSDDPCYVKIPDSNRQMRLIELRWEDFISSNLLDLIKRLLVRGYSDRLNFICLREVSINNGYSCIIGLKFSPNIVRFIDRGPNVGTKEAQNFQNFWGEKAEKRRFKDGSIVETVVWNNNVMKHVSKHHIFQTNNLYSQIFNYIISMYLPEASINSLENGIPIICSIICPFGVTELYSNNERNIYDSFNNFKTKILQLTSIPLTIKSVLSASPYLKFMDYSHYITNKLSNKISSDFNKNLRPIPCIIEMEQSNAWPQNNDAIEKIKVAFLLTIRKELIEIHGIGGDIVPKISKNIPYNLEELKESYNECIDDFTPFLDVYWDSTTTFRLCIFHPNELIELAQKTIEVEKLTQDIIINNTLKPLNLSKLKSLWWNTKTSERLSTLGNIFPPFRATVKKLKQFASIHKIQSSEEFIEHIVAYIYISSKYPWSCLDTPTTPTTGFMRALWLLANTDWSNMPLIVDLNYQQNENSDITFMSEEIYDKLEMIYHTKKKLNNGKLPYFYISSEYDPQCLMINLPSNYNSKRFIHIAKLYIKTIINNSPSLPKNELFMLANREPVSDLVLTLETNYDILIHPQTKKSGKFAEFQAKYVNLDSKEALKYGITKVNSFVLSMELFDYLISDLKVQWNELIEFIFDPYQQPYPDKVYIKYKPTSLLAKPIKLQSDSTLSSCILKLDDNVLIRIPNLLLLFKYIWDKSKGFIVSIKIN
ncbi:hypothetical protein ACR3K2_12910 [Cryptosporidium serpentis]